MAMTKSLVIVESPAKAKTIEKYLGKGFEVRASVGHIMDLPKNEIGVELEKRTFVPELVVSPGKEKVVDQLKKLAAKADEIYLAPDPDREGEAIAYHLALQLGTVRPRVSRSCAPQKPASRRPPLAREEVWTSGWSSWSRCRDRRPQGAPRSSCP